MPSRTRDPDPDESEVILPHRSDLVDDENQPRLSLAIEHFLKDIGKTNKELSEELLDMSYSTYQRRKNVVKGPADRTFISRVAQTLSRWYDDKYDNRLGSRSLIDILDTLLWSASETTLDGDPLWPTIVKNNKWRVGYTKAGKWINTDIKSSSGNIRKSRPKSDENVVEYTELISGVLGIDVEWYYAQNWKILIENTWKGEIDVIAPFIMKTPSRKRLLFSDTCGKTEGISALVGKRDPKASTIEKMSISGKSFETVFFGKGREGEGISNDTKTELIYISQEIGQHASRAFEVIYGDKKSCLTTVEKNNQQEVERIFQDDGGDTIPVFITEKSTCYDIISGRKDTTELFNLESEYINRIAEGMAFACPSGENEMADAINSAIEIVGTLN